MPKFKKLIPAVAAFSLLFNAIPFVAAQQAPSGSGLSISPTISQYTIKQGGSQSLTITLKNVTVDAVVAKGEVDDFKADNLTGNPQIITNSNQTSPNSIKPFVNNLDDVPLAKGQQKQVIIGLDIPKNTPAGAYYGVIRYRAIPKNLAQSGPGQVALTASVGTIVLITVPGNIRTQVHVDGLQVYRGARSGTLFVKTPNKVGIKITNFGNGFIQPFGDIEIHDMFNKSVANFPFNNPKQLGNILPNSSRTFTHNFSGVHKIGRYTVLASVSYGNGGQVLTLQKTFWYIPVWLIIIIVIILAGLFYLAYRSWRAYKRSQRHGRR